MEVQVFFKGIAPPSVKLAPTISQLKEGVLRRIR